MAAKEEKKEKDNLFPYAQNPGEKTRDIRQWNETETDLEIVETIDIQKEIDEAAKGMTIGEQLARLAYGDTSVLKSGEPVYADVSGVPETYGEYMNTVKEASKNLAAESEKGYQEAVENLSKVEKNDENAAEIAAAEKELAAAKAKLDILKGGR